MVTRKKFSIDSFALYTPEDVDSTKTFLSGFRSPVQAAEIQVRQRVQAEFRFKKSNGSALLYQARNITPEVLHEDIGAMLGITPQSIITLKAQDNRSFIDMRSLIAFFSDYNKPWYVTTQARERASMMMEHFFVLGTHPPKEIAYGEGWREEVPELFRPSRYQRVR